ncbi:MAG: universal stress protein [Rhodospirillaceae bacterium]|nr:universal stress protein [Rhodospirillaceae bacterium]
MAKVLVPIDGSKNSIRALAYIALRARRGENIQAHVLFVQPTALPSLYVTRSMIKDWQKAERDRVFSNPKIKTLTKRLKAHICLETGDVAEAILKAARKYRCAEIVMGSRGLGRLKRLILGSVATKIIHASPVPVTIVK